MPNLAYFITDYYEKLYDDSLTSLSIPTNPTPSLLTSPPTILNTSNPLIAATTTPPSNTGNQQNVASKTSPPIVLKISTRKYEIVASMKTQLVENELCSTLILYLIIVCIEINDWINLKVLLPCIKYPRNNSMMFEKWFLYLFFNTFNEKTMDQFKHDWFVSLIFDEFLFTIMQQKDLQAQSASSSSSTSAINASNTFYEHIYKFIEKIYPSHLTTSSFVRLIEIIKPKKMVNI